MSPIRIDVRRVQACLLPLWIAALASTAFSQGILYDVAPRPPQIGDRSRPSNRLILEEERVDGDIRETNARYKIVERFRNPNPQPIEGVYLCPIPHGATARGLALVVNGKRMNGEILDAGKAGDVYRDIVRRMRDPALLEHVGDGLLRASVFPVPANGCVDVEIDLEAPIGDVGSGMLEISIPLKQVAEAHAHLALDLSITTERHLDTIYSPTHGTTLTRDGDTHARIQVNGTVESPNDFLLYFAADSPKGTLRVLTHRQAGRDGYFQLLSQASDDLAAGAARDVVFVLDRSGSMQGEKWDQAVRSLTFGIKSLRPQDRFDLLSFATDVRAYSDRLTEASDANKNSAIEHLNALRAAGGTDISGALARALPLLEATADRLPLIVFVTDGQPTVGEVDPSRILQSVAASNPAKARMFTFGLGFDVNTFLLDRLAEDNAAESDYVAPQQDLEIPLSAFFAKVAEPAIVNPTLKIEGSGIELFDTEPARIPDLFVGDTLRIAGRFRGHGKAKLTLSGTHAGKPVVITREIEIPEIYSKNDYLPGQWASRRIGHLLNEIRLHGQTKELVDSVCALGTEFGIVTPYTSGLVVEDGAAARPSPPAGPFNGPSTGGGGPSAGGGAGLARKAAPRGDGGSSVGSSGFLSGQGAKPAAGEDAVKAALDLKKLERGEVVAKRLQDSEGATRQAAGRTFKKSGGIWTDSTFTEAMRAGMREIEAFSDDYFAFAAEHKELSEVLAIGDNLILVVGERAIRIRPVTGA